MADILSNRAEVARNLAYLAGAFNLRRTPRGFNDTLGQSLIDSAALAIEHRSVDEQLDPLGRPWEPLKPRTIARKQALGFDLRINIETHEMLDIEQVRGEDTITANTATMTAGTNDDAKMKFSFAEQGGANRPERPIYDLGKDGEAAADQVFIDAATEASE